MNSHPRFCNDGSDAAARLVPFLNLGCLTDLPAESTAPAAVRGGGVEQMEALREAGFAGVQGGDAEHARAAGLRVAADGRVNEPGDAAGLARRAAEAGAACVTLHAGWGMETDAQADAIAEAVLAAEADTGLPMCVETHRSTVTQDLFRTVKLLERHPTLAINADFSHWYTGLEMPYAGVEKVCGFIAPVFANTRFVHGRIGDSGSMQVDAGGSVEEAERLAHVQHFETMWTGVFRAFKTHAGPGDWLGFAPELLPPGINYARLFPDGEGGWREETDRWQQALLYVELAQRWFDAA